MNVRGLSLRGLFVLIGMAAAVYVAVLAILVGRWLGPTSAALHSGSAHLLEVHDSVAVRLDRLDGAVAALQRVLIDARPSLAPVVADSLAGPALDVTRSATAFTIARELRDLPDEGRIALGRAASYEMRMGARIVEVAAALQLGRHDDARAGLIEVATARDSVARFLGTVQRVAIADVFAREAAVVSATTQITGAILWWTLLALVLTGVVAVLLRRRLYRPLAELEGAIGRVASGDVSVTVDDRNGDEIGRLGGMLNQLTLALRERAEDERRHRENIIERYGRIIDDSSSEIFLIDPDSLAILDANRGAARGTGYDLTALRKRIALDLWTSLAREDLDQRIRDLRNGRQARSSFSTEQARVDGSVYPVDVTLQFSPGEHSAIAAIVTDLSERQRVEHLNERLVRAALHGTQALQTTNLQTVASSINEMGAEALGVGRASVWRMAGDHLECVDLFLRDAHRHEQGTRLTVAEFPNYFNAVRSERAVAAHDVFTDERTAQLAPYLRDNGITSLLDAPVRVGGQLAGVISFEHTGPAREWTIDEQIFAGSVADIASLAFEAGERRRAEASLRESEERYRSTFFGAPVGILEADADTGLIVSANEAFCRLIDTSLDELRGRHWSATMQPGDVETATGLLGAVREGTDGVLHREWCFVSRSGRQVWTELSVTRIASANGRGSRLLMVAHDMTAQRTLREQLSHAQRMDSIGQLAGGVAHDFNNILTAILGYVDLCRSQVGAGDPLDEELQQIERAGQRAADLTRQLLTFARRQVVEPRFVDVNDLTRNVQKMVGRLIGENIALELDLAPGVGTTRIDAGQFEQVIVNLAVNARDAMPGGGRITITTRDVEVRDGQFGPIADLAPGPYVSFSLSDTGVGMSPDVMERAFEPFFTTKVQGKGTGLGLATCYGIVRQAGGHVTIESTPGRGTTITCLLPRVDSSPQAADTNGATPAGHGRGETILVVEDELQVRKLIERTLRRSGYQVLVASDGDEAIRLFRSRPDDIDLVITDLVMPKISGPDVIMTLRRERPSLPAMCMSGYSEHRAVENLGVELISKPFQTVELAARVRRLLDVSGGR